MERDEIADQTNCKYDRWPEQLLKLAFMNDRCHRRDANSVEASGVRERHSSLNTADICTAYNGATTMPVDAADDIVFGRGMHLRLGSAKVPSTSDGLLGCEFCVDLSKGVSQRAAEYFCEKCSTNLLCYECKQSHDKHHGNKHRVLLIDENDDLKHTSSRIPPVLCQLHDSTPCDLWCRSCDVAKCQECALQCAKRFHSICSSDELDLRSSTDQLDKSASKLEEICSKFRHIESALKLEHKADMMELKKRKIRILDALDSAFSAAQGTLERSYRETRQWVSNLRYNVDSSVRCGRSLSRHLLPSHGILIKRAQRAIDHDIHTAQRLMAREDAVLARLGSTKLGDDLKDVMKSWIGSPALPTVPDTNEVTCVTLLADNAALRQPQFPLYDIAATLSGHILVAHGKVGLLEIDSMGFTLDAWLPTPAATSDGIRNHQVTGTQHVLEEVVSVDCLKDDRAVVGLKDARAVVLLKRESEAASSEWREQRRFDLEQGAPFAVSTRDNLLVIALGSVNGDSRELLPGKHLIAFNLVNGIRGPTVELDFEISSVVVAARNEVIVSSHHRVQSTCKGQFVIESRESDLKHCLWRISRDNPILGLTASASGHQIYVSIARERGPRVIALDTKTGLSKGAVARIQDDVRDFYCQVKNSPSSRRHRSHSNTTCTIASIPNAVAEARSSASGDTQHANWLKSNAVFGKLSSSKSQNSRLVALGFDSKTMFHLSTNLEQLSLKDPFRRSIYLTKKVFTVIGWIALGLVSTILVTGLIFLCFGLILMDLKALGVDSHRLTGYVVTIGAIYLLHVAQGCVEKATKSQMRYLLSEFQRFTKYPLIRYA